jgi:hypothetical protein
VAMEDDGGIFLTSSEQNLQHLKYYYLVDIKKKKKKEKVLTLETIELFYAESTRRNLPRCAQARSYLCFILFFQQQELLKINKFFIFELIF